MELLKCFAVACAGWFLIILAIAGIMHPDQFEALLGSAKKSSLAFDKKPSTIITLQGTHGRIDINNITINGKKCKPVHLPAGDIGFNENDLQCEGEK